MKKCLPITLLVSLLCFGAGCTPKDNSSTGGNTPTSSSVAKVTVSSVEIEYDGETTVLAGSTAKLSAEAKMSDGSKGKVVWSSSNEDVAKVTNGTVAFKNVSEDATVTITATSKDDSSKSASVTFEVKFTAINFANSRGNFDSSLYLEENSVIVEKADSALLFNEVHGTKWYVEADVTPSTDLGTETDQYPKFGIMTGSDANGYWNTECKNLFYFVDAQNPATTSSWTSMGFVGQNDTHSDWAWSTDNKGFSVSADNRFAKEETTKMGMLRDGVNYYLYAGRGDGYGVVKHFVHDMFAADEASYAWFGGWQSAYTLSNASYLIGDEVDVMYKDATAITLASYSETLFINDTYQIGYTLNEEMFNPSKLTFTSSDPAVATVSQTGLVTAGSTAGTATITVAYGEVKAELAIEVTTDEKFKVELDGKMNDLIWSDEVKASPVSISRENFHAKVEMFASRNSRGVYLFANYECANEYSSATEWWKGDNIELRMVGNNGILPNKAGGDQYFASTASNGVHTFTNAYISRPVLNEETGYYEVKFELFASYLDLGLTSTSNIGFHMGANPGGNDVGKWFCESDKWLNSDLAVNNKITENGIVSTYTAETCKEHKHTTWTTDVQVTCKHDGTEKSACVFCGTEETREVKSTGEHVWNSEEQTIIEAATCTHEGKAGAPCYGYDECGAVSENITLPIDLYNHTAWDEEAGECSDCHNTLKEAIFVDRFNAGGWGDVNTWTYLAKDLAGDFEVVTTFELETNGVVGNWWRGALPIVQHELPAGSEGEGSPWVTRFDWWGWCDAWQSGEKLTNDWNDVEGDRDMVDDSGNRDIWWSNAEGNNVQGSEFETSMTKGTFVWTCTRVGTVVTNSFVITSEAGTFTFWSKATDISADKNLSIALASEFARYTVKKVEIK